MNIATASIVKVGNENVDQIWIGTNKVYIKRKTYTLTPGSVTRVSNTNPWKLNDVFPVATQTAIIVTTNLFFPQTQIFPYKTDGTLSGIYFFIYSGAWVSSATSPVALPAVGNDTQLSTDFNIYHPSGAGTKTFIFPA
jgi:hypothetical protein